MKRVKKRKMNQKRVDARLDRTMLMVRTLATDLISAAQGLKNELLKFLLLVVIAFIFGGIFIPVAYGCWAGILLLSLIMIFVLVVLGIFRKSLFKQSSKLQAVKKRRGAKGKSGNAA
jgi:hypothetical protein